MIMKAGRLQGTLKGTLIGIALLLPVTVTPSGAGWAQGLAETTYIAAWTISGSQAYAYVGIGKGYYKEEGIALKVARGFGSGDTAKRTGLADGNVFGEADVSAMIKVRAEGVKVKAVGIIAERNPLQVVSLKRFNVTNPKDLEGKTIAISPGGMEATQLLPFVQANGLDLNNITVMNMAPGPMSAAVSTGKVHAALLASTTASVIIHGRKIEMNALDLEDHGVPVYSWAIVTRDELVERSQGLVRGFVRATYRAFLYQEGHPEEAIDILVRYHPELTDKQAELYGLKAKAKVLFTETARQKGLGWMDEKKIRYTRDLITKAWKLKEVPVQDLYTNAFLPGLFPR
ncbi:MAG: ABC transporter substrate-binding protein [Candidatus Rokubacteria bacterium]|nr:ABC transporter substrate-binding protein [Candidatus Rokubacteria bacterium]